MAKTKGKIEFNIVHGLRGILDFYRRGNETIIRTWPKNKGNSQTPNSVPWQRVFSCFHKHFGGEWIGGLPDVADDLKGDRWTRRDYLMWLYYGKSPHARGLTLDDRDPFPPPCPDPLNRLALFNLPIGGYSIFQGVVLFFSRHPTGHAIVWYTYTAPRYYRSHRSNRRGKYESGVRITPKGPFFLQAGAPINPTALGTNSTSFFRDLDRRFYFFIVPFTGAFSRTISQSGWYVCRIKPGPGGSEIGATLDGPWHLSTYHLDHPDRPLS